MVWVVNGDMVWSILALSGLVLKDSQDYLVSEYLGFLGSSDDSYDIYAILHWRSVRFHRRTDVGKVESRAVFCLGRIRN